MVGKGTQAYKATEENARALLEGVAISIDPSIGSSSSMPGWAVYRKGKLVGSGTVEIPPTLPVWERLRRLHRSITRLYKKYSPDVLVYEEIPVQRYGAGGNAAAHVSLLKAVGVILSVPGTSGCVGIQPQSWKRLARSSYVKGDEADAIEIGWIVLEIARHIQGGRE